MGAAIKTHVARVPATFMPPAIREFHQAWRTLPEYHRNVVAVVYRASVPADEKAEALGVSRATLYRLLGEAHGYMSAKLGDGNDDIPVISHLSQIVPRPSVG